MKKNQNREQILKNLVNSEVFEYIESDFMERIAQLENLSELDALGTAETLQLQVRARQEAATILRKVLNEWKSYGGQGDKGGANPFNRSMR